MAGHRTLDALSPEQRLLYGGRPAASYPCTSSGPW